MNLNLAELETYLPQGESARHTPLRAAREGTWQRAEAAPLVSSSIKLVDGKLTVPAGKTAQLNMEWPLPGAQKLAARKLEITLEETAELTLLEIFKGQGWAADSLSITADKGAKLHHGIVQHAAGIVTRSEAITLADNATYRRLALQAGSELARLDVSLTLASHCKVNTAGIHLCGKGQTLDQTTLLTLNGPGNACSVQQRNVVGGGGQSVFQGKYFVARAAQQTDGYMLVKNLLLEDGALAFGKPELEIYADDVKCSHGASTGGINAEQLFYLKSRGVSEAAARQLIVAGFAEELLGDLASPQPLGGGGWPEEFLAAATPVVHTWLEGIAHDA